MILEVAVLDVRSGMAASFEAAFLQPLPSLSVCRGMSLISYNAAWKYPIAMFFSLTGRPLKPTRLDFAALPNIRIGNACSTIFTTHSPPWNTTSRCSCCRSKE